MEVVAADGYRCTSPSSRHRDVPKALVVWSDKDKGKIFEQLYGFIKKELEARNISVTCDWNDEDCNLGIALVTERFIGDSVPLITELWRKLRIYRYSIIFCDYPKRSYFKVMLDEDNEDIASVPRNRYSKEPRSSLVLEAQVLKMNSYPKWSYTALDDSDNASKVAEKFAVAAVRVFNPKPIDYNLTNPCFELYMLDLNFQLFIQEQNTHLDKDVIIGVFANRCECPSCYTNIINISKMLYNINQRGKNYYTYSIYIPPEAFLIIDDPLAFQNALLALLYKQAKPSDDRLSLHEKENLNKIRFFIVIEIEDFVPHVFEQQLNNLTKLIAKGSLVIVTATKSTKLFEYKAASLWKEATVQGPACNKEMRPLYFRMVESLLLLTKVQDANILKRPWDEVNSINAESTERKKPYNVDLSPQ